MSIKNRIFYSVLFKFIPRNWKFKLIHTFNLWASPESISGPGSEITNTKATVQFLKNFLVSEKIKSILDIPCGDFNWMKTIDLSEIEYLGGDVVSALIKTNNQNYGKKNINFRTIDIINETLPKSDLVIVRDLFIHFSQENTKKAIENIKQSNSKYLLVTTFPDSHENKSIKDGYNYNINLQSAPFNFPQPLQLIEEQIINTNEKKCMGLWSVKDL